MRNLGRHGGIRRRRWRVDNPLLVVSIGNKNGEHQGEKEEGGSKVGRSLLQHVGGLRAEHLIGHPGSKSRPQTLLLGTLHEHHENEQRAHRHKSDEHKVDQDIHADQKTRGAGLW